METNARIRGPVLLSGKGARVRKLQAWFIRLLGVFNRADRDSDLKAELESHLQMHVEDNLHAGLDPVEARRRALMDLGGLESIREACRDRGGLPGLENFMRDVRHGVRRLRQSPGFTTVAVLTLALGIGANTTIFSIINTVLLKPIKVHEPGRLAGLFQHDRDNPNSFEFFSYPDFADLRSAKDAAFTDLLAFGVASVGLQGELTEKIGARLVSANYFSALGVAPALGRGFLQEEENSGSAVAVLSYSFWNRLGAERSIVGRKLKLTRGEVTVVGVMPRGFSGDQVLTPDLFLPLGMLESLSANPGQPAPHILANRGDRRFMLIGRLKPGLTLANVDGALWALNQKFSIPDPAQPKPRTLMCTPPSRFNYSNQPPSTEKSLLPLAGLAFGLSTLVLVIACLNLANMMLARGAARQKEIAVRLALGAGRRRVLSQLLTEGLLLALLGGASGLLVSVWSVKLLTTFIYSGSGMPADFPVLDFSPDARELVAVLLLSGLAALCFALGPAWKLTRLDVNSDLKRHAGEDVRKPGKFRFGVRECLAIGQLASALALLVAAALFSRSAMRASVANPGFEYGANFYLALDTGLTGYAEPHVRELLRSATERLSALPGVESVSSAMNIPFGDNDWVNPVQIGGAPPPSDSATTLAQGKELSAIYNVVGAKYFHTLGLPILRGREFERHEVEASNAPPVAIISQNLAIQLWPGEEAVGRSIQFPASRPGVAPILMTVVGVVPAVHWHLYESELPAQVYVPFGQDFQPNLKLHVRVGPGIDPAKLITEARGALRRLDPDIPLTEIKTLEAFHRDGPNVRMANLGSVLFGAFGGLAVLLSMLGVYGLKAYSVSRRTREIGIRMALGANGRDVVAMILRESAWLSGLGLGLGLLLAFAVGKLAGSFLYQVSAMDPLTFGVIPPLLLAVTMLACFIPARRAARIHPMQALRCE